MANPTPYFFIEQGKPRPRGRKPSKAPPPCKKPRGRGLGVAQLEEIINKSTTSEINHHPAANPLDPVPVQVQVGVPLMVHNNGYFFDQGFANGSGFSRVNPHSLGPFWSNPYVFGAPVGSNGGSVFENSSELSSMPKLIHHYEKRFVNEDECIGYYTGKKEKFSEMSPILSGSDFKGPNLDHQMGGFGAQFPYNNNNLTTGGAEVVTVHRKMEAKGRSFFMEYEFFPDRKDTNFKEREVENLGLGLGFQDPKSTSCLKISEYNSAATTTTPNSVDLSLKLSF